MARLKTIRLELAREPQFPEGSHDHGYEFLAPLGNDGRIDPEAWRDQRRHCRVLRFWKGDEKELGHLVHTRQRTWAFHYDIEGDPEDDEPGYRFDDHRFKEGEYVSIREHDGVLRTFKVASVRDAGP